MNKIIILICIAILFLIAKNSTHESSPLMEAYMEVWEADKEKGSHVIANFIAFYNHNDASGKVPTDEGLCMNMCREIK